MNFIIKVDFAYSIAPDEIKTEKDAYLVSIDSRCGGIFKEIPSQYADLPLLDYTGKLIIPGMIDLHLHAPQFAFRGMYMDEELLDWLQKYIFVVSPFSKNSSSASSEESIRET